MSSGNFTMQIDLAAVAKARKELANLSGAELEKTLKKAVRSAAGAYAVPLRNAARRHTKGPGGTTPSGKRIGIGKVGNGYGEPGGLARSIRVKRVIPASAGGVSSGIGFFTKEGFTRSWVVRGTKAHRIVPEATTLRENITKYRSYSRGRQWQHRGQIRRFEALSVGSRAELALPGSGGTFHPMVQHPGMHHPDHFVAAVGRQYQDKARDAMVRAIVRDASRRG